MKTLTRITSLRFAFDIKTYLLLLGVIVIFSTQTAKEAHAALLQHEIQVDFTFDTSGINNKEVSGYKLYKEGVAVCEIGPIDQQSFNCFVGSEPGTFDFTIIALFSDYTESMESAPFSFTFVDDSTVSENTCESTSGNKSFSFSWESPTDFSDVMAYRFYLNNSYLCETYDPTAISITLKAYMLNEVMSFNMASVYTNGVESNKSNVLKFDPADFPEMYPEKSLTFSWDYQSNTNNTGFRVYHNNTLSCETLDPLAFQLTCSMDLADSNIFNITALHSDGSESNLSNPIVYKTPTMDTGQTALAANIIVDRSMGESPFTLTFDGSGSGRSVDIYRWTFGDGHTAIGANVQHTYQLAGTYTATLTVTNSFGLTSNSSVDIIVTDPVIVTEPEAPTAIIYSSSTIGEVSFSVNFDGSASTTMQPPFTAYNWDFDDGTTAHGMMVSHTFTTAGSYQTRLTVIDSAGLVDTVTTPVLITEPSSSENQPPTAHFSITPTTGQSPLTVNCDASDSSDSDGAISSYYWDFGDGTKSSSPTASHTYENNADYIVTLTVTDDGGLDSSVSENVHVLQTASTPISLELGELELNHEWNSVSLEQPFVKPVIISSPPSYAGGEPTTTRMRNIASNNFEIRLQEWSYLDGSHANELVSYLAMEAGVFTLGNGARIEAGTFKAGDSFKEISLQHSYDSAPIILTQVISFNYGEAVTGRIRNVNNSSFEYKLQGQESTKNQLNDETVAYIAWEHGNGHLFSGLYYKADATANTVTHDWYTLNFKEVFPDLPFIYANMQTQDGGDTAALRVKSNSNTSFEVKVEEEQSRDSETNHTTEKVGYLVFSQQKNNVSDEKQLIFNWNFDSALEDTINGFRIYSNNSQICEIIEPSIRQLECTVTLDALSHDFNIRAISLNDMETSSSNIINYTP